MDMKFFRSRLNTLGYAHILLQPPAQGSVNRTVFNKEFEVSKETGALLVIETIRRDTISILEAEIEKMNTRQALSWIQKL